MSLRIDQAKVDQAISIFKNGSQKEIKSFLDSLPLSTVEEREDVHCYEG